MTLKDIPWYGQIAAAAIITGLLVFSQFKMAPLNLQEKKARIETLKKELEGKQAEIQKGEAAAAEKAKLERDIAALELKLADLRQILPTQPELGDLLKWIKSLADQTNLDLRLFSPGALGDREFLREQPIKMDVIGNYHQLGMFFDRVGKYARIINIENVRVIPNPDRTVRATIQASFMAKTYIFREDLPSDASAEEPPKSGKKGGGR